MNPPGVSEPDLVFLWMHIDVYALLRHEEKQNKGRVPAMHQNISKCLANGMGDHAVANDTAVDEKELAISARTIEKHRSNLMKKLDVRSLADAIRLVLQSNEQSGEVSAATDN